MASIYRRSGRKHWYVSWRDETGRRRTRNSHTTDKAVARRLAAKYEAEAALRREGVIDPAMEAISVQAQRTIESHLKDYENKLRAGGRSDKHIRDCLRIVRIIAEQAGFTTAGDISADGVAKYARTLQDEGRSDRTIKKHVQAMRAFAKWLADGHKLHRNPLAAPIATGRKVKRKRERRFILPDEWRWLEYSLSKAPVRCGMAAEERLLLYQVALQTGYRSGELRSITRGLLFLDDDPPHVDCDASNTKDGKRASQAIDRELAERLRVHVARKAPNAAVFAMPHETNVARMLRADLEHARSLWLAEAKDDPQEYANRQASDFLATRDSHGRLVDFHTIRHTCGAWLAEAGRHPKTVQAVMRHKQITLTMDTYGHLFPGQEAEAVQEIAAMLKTEPERAAATGTDGEKWQRQWQRAGSATLPMDAKPCEAARETAAQKKTPKPLAVADLGDSLRDNASGCLSSGGGTRTPDTRIMIPLL